MSAQLAFPDGSIATVHYWTNGPRSFPKERVEVFSEGRAITIDNWRALRRFDWPGAPRPARLWARQDKGHRAEVAAFLERVASGGEPLVPFAEIERVTRAAFACVRSARDGVCVDLASREAAVDRRTGGAAAPATASFHKVG